MGGAFVLGSSIYLAVQEQDSRDLDEKMATSMEGSSRICGGYDADFVEPLPDHLECPVCLLALREPNILSCCGIKVCYTCIDQVGKKGCPVCREEGFNTMLEKQLCRSILNLKVYCRHKDKGCEWTGELRDLDKHLAIGENNACSYIEVVCQYGCGMTLVSSEVEMHQLQDCPKRPLEAQMYQLQEVVKRMKEEHLQEIRCLEARIVEQGKEIDSMKSRMDALEEKNSALQVELNRSVSSSGPPAPPPPPIQFNVSQSSSSGHFHQGVPPPPPPLPGVPPPRFGMRSFAARTLPPPSQSRPGFVSSHPPATPPAPPPPPLPFSPKTMLKLANGRTVSLIAGDICLQDVDAIVCSSSRSMKHTAGVSLALDQASRGMLQVHSDRLVLHSGDLGHGEVVATAAGGWLKCSHIVHAIPPLPKYSSGSDIKMYKALIMKCLEKVELLNARSVAFAAIGTGGRERKVELMASAMLDSLSSYAYSSAKLTDLRIVVIERKVYNGFVEVMEGKRRVERMRERGVRERIADYFTR